MEHKIKVLEEEILLLRKCLSEKEKELQELKSTQSTTGTNAEIERNEIFDNPLKTVCNLSASSIERYSRQILVPELGYDGQVRLSDARVLIVGAGGLGCPAALYLAGAGIGKLGIVDHDAVERTNLHRQILHTELHCGMKKADSAIANLKRLNSTIEFEAHNVSLNSENAMEILSKYDLVLDASDNVVTRYLLNDACVLQKIPLISGSALKMEGQLTIYNYRSDRDDYFEGPCYRCLFPEPPPPETIGSCSANGVIGPVPGVIGCLQALEAIKLIARRPHTELLAGRLLIFDGEETTFRNIKLRAKNPECVACSNNPKISMLTDYELFCKSQARETASPPTTYKAERMLAKRLRMLGKPYCGTRKSTKGERRLGPPCTSDYCARAARRKCRDISQTDRRKIFEEFWRLEWTEKKRYIQRLVDTVEPRKRRKNREAVEEPRKKDSKLYHLEVEGERLNVCRAMFLSTLDLREQMASGSSDLSKR